MFAILTILAALISGMFVLTVASSVSLMQRENEDIKSMAHRRELF
ncbi:hypothetical protein [Rhizobium halophytocola]|uniref:Uncharacterized protein n=1 Tax=Rhizobium halophytocola TaxID=735519 RepID=A0ABS4DWP3_9HYPH|nr:hypothetical protein [Rhizobium halophytocola]MBP1850111.1 hypothetical protein [Rhizobium halophytocola]